VAIVATQTALLHSNRSCYSEQSVTYEWGTTLFVYRQRWVGSEFAKRSILEAIKRWTVTRGKGVIRYKGIAKLCVLMGLIKYPADLN
jgi:hypothetical protein